LIPRGWRQKFKFCSVLYGYLFFILSHFFPVTISLGFHFVPCPALEIRAQANSRSVTAVPRHNFVDNLVLTGEGVVSSVYNLPDTPQVAQFAVAVKMPC